MDRRDFGKQLALAAAAASLPATMVGCKRDQKPPRQGGSTKASTGTSSTADAKAPEQKPEPKPMPALQAFDARQAATLIAALDRLFPAAHGLPSASEAHVAVFIDRQVSQPKYAGLKRVMISGLVSMDSVSRRDHRKRFAEADTASQDDVLQRFQTNTANAGRFNQRRFFEIFMTLGMEGYMGHPVHGGNVDGVAWRAVGIHWPTTLGTMKHP